MVFDLSEATPVASLLCSSVENNGLLSVKLPSGLPAGYYLARPELIALHAVAEDNDPQDEVVKEADGQDDEE